MSNKSLHALVVDAMDITRSLVENGGEVTEEIAGKLMVNETQLAEKVDSCVYVIEQMEHQEAYFKAKAKEFSAIAKGFETARERLRENIKGAICALDTDEIKGGDYRYKLVLGKPSLVVREAEIPQEYKLVKVEPDKEKIRAALADGFEVEGAEFVESVQLRVYKNSKKE